MIVLTAEGDSMELKQTNTKGLSLRLCPWGEKNRDIIKTDTRKKKIKEGSRSLFSVYKSVCPISLAKQ